MATTLSFYRGENGFVAPINIKQGGVDRALTDFLEADSEIIIKEINGGNAVLTLNSDDFDFDTPNVNWTVTDTHTALLTKSNYKGFVHLKHDVNSLEEIAVFNIIILDA